MNSRFTPDVLRFGAFALVALAALVLMTDGAESSHSYAIASKPRTKIREIRFDPRPRSLSTAIRFGKRDSNVRYSDADRRGPMMFSAQTDVSQKFPLVWFLQYLRSNPELANRAVRELLSDDADDDDDDEENARSSAPRRYKKGSDGDDSYYMSK